MSKFRTIGSVVIAGSFGGLAAVLCLGYLRSSPTPAAFAASAPPAVYSTVDGPSRKIQIERGQDLSFKAPVSINGQNVTMLVDTGANITVLTRDDALRSGILQDESAGHVDVRGINNDVTRFRNVGTRTVQLGPISIENVPISVDDSGHLSSSILGQDAFCNLTRITIEKNQLEMMHNSPVATGCPKTA